MREPSYFLLAYYEVAYSGFLTKIVATQAFSTYESPFHLMWVFGML